jgi:hypothetical protein
VGGESAKSLSRHVKENPREVKLKRGAGVPQPKQLWYETDSRTEQSPEGGQALLALWSNLQQAVGGNDRRAKASDELVRLSARENP